MADTLDELFDKMQKSFLQMVQHQVKGNGVNPKSVSFEADRTEVITVSGKTRISMKPHISSTQKPGRIQAGEIVQAGGAQHAAESYANSVLGDAGVFKAVQQEILGRDDHGIGVTQETIVGDAYAKEFTEHVACHQCGGQSQQSCHYCQSTGYEACYKCKGMRDVPCYICKGQGQIQQPDGRLKQCYACHGRRQISCDICRGQGRLACKQCQGKRFIECQSCQGQGFTSQISEVKIAVVADFEQDISMAPDVIKKYIADKGLRASVLKKDFRAKLAEDKHDRRLEKGALIYDIDIPHVAGTLSFGKKQLAGSIIGFNATGYGFPNYMDMILTKPYKVVYQAATGKGDVTAALQQAAKYRFFRFIISGVISKSEKKLRKKISSIHSVGLSDKMLKSATKAVNLALKNVTRRPRYIGLAVSLVLAALVCALWFKYEIRVLISNAAGIDGLVGISLDLLPIPVLMVLSYMGIRVCGFLALKKVMSLVPNDNKRLPLPKSGRAGLWAMISVPVIWCMCGFLFSENGFVVFLVLKELLGLS